MSCPLPFSSAHSFRRLSDVHNCRRIGSPRVAGSSNALRSESRVGSSVILDLRPPPCRRIRSFSAEARSSRSSSPRYLDILSVAPDPSPQPRRLHHRVQSYVLPTPPSGVGSARRAKEPSPSNVSEEL